MTDGAKIREVMAGVYVVHLPLPMKPTIVNVTLLHSGDEWALIDTGVDTEESHAALLAAMSEVGCAPRQVRTLIGTHHHPDHFGASAWFKEITGARVLLHEREAQSAQHYAPTKHSDVAIRFFLENGIPLRRFTKVPSAGEFWAKLYRPTTPDSFIVDGDHVRVGDFDLEVVGTPGHTSGHCVLYARREKLMVVGDHLLPKITPHVGYFPDGPTDPLGDFMDSQRKVQGFDVALVLPAHGGTFAEAGRRAGQIIQHHEYRLREMHDLIMRVPRTAYEVASLSFGFDFDSPLQIQFPATFETLAHLEHLRVQGKVVRELVDDLSLYRSA